MSSAYTQTYEVAQSGATTTHAIDFGNTDTKCISYLFTYSDQASTALAANFNNDGSTTPFQTSNIIFDDRTTPPSGAPWERTIVNNGEKIYTNNRYLIITNQQASGNFYVCISYVVLPSINTLKGLSVKTLLNGKNTLLENTTTDGTYYVVKDVRSIETNGVTVDNLYLSVGDYRLSTIVTQEDGCTRFENTGDIFLAQTEVLTMDVPSGSSGDFYAYLSYYEIKDGI